MIERMFPIQGGAPVPWSVAERAYRVYAFYYGTSQSLERLAERGGFGAEEIADLLEGGNGAGAAAVVTRRAVLNLTDRAADVARLTAELAQARGEAERATAEAAGLLDALRRLDAIYREEQDFGDPPSDGRPGWLRDALDGPGPGAAFLAEREALRAVEAAALDLWAMLVHIHLDSADDGFNASAARLSLALDAAEKARS